MIWIYDLPPWLLCILMAAVYSTVSLIGSALLRSWVGRKATDAMTHNSLDRPFRGRTSISPAPYELVRDQLMGGLAAGS